MNTSKLLFTTLTVILGILVLTAQSTPVSTTPVQPSPSPTPSSEQHHVSMATYVAMVKKVVSAQQEIGLLLIQKYNLTNYTTAQNQRFEYCFLKDIANPPSNNLTIEERMSNDYQVIEELTVPLRDVLNYEAHINSNSDKYRKLVWTERQINSSLEEIQNMRNSDLLMEQLSLQPSEDSQSSNTASNSTQMQQGRCDGLVDNSVDEYRDLIELYIGLTFTVRDLLDIEHERA